MLFSPQRAATRAFLTVLIAVGGAEAASAQSQRQLLPDRDCACVDLAIREGRREIALRKAAYEEQTRAVARMEAELAQLKPRVDVDNQASVDAYRMKLEERENARDILQNNTLPDYQTAVAAYNENLSVKEKRCTAVVYDEAAVQRAFPNLVCRR